MDVAERIARRRASSAGEDLVADWDMLAPTVHLDEPVGRGSVIERLLDTMEPLFDGDLPPNIVIQGPQGSGKSAIVLSLLSNLTEEFSRSRPRLYTATRGGEVRDHPRFAYVDARRTSTGHKFYHDVLEHLTQESVPERGVGTDALRDRIEATLAGSHGAVVTVDHVDETDALHDPIADLGTEFDTVALVGIGRTDPGEAVPTRLAAEVEVPAYRTHELIDLLTVRANRGLASGITHAQARRIATWADGNAHDALAALFAATMVAQEAGHTQLRESDIKVGTQEMRTDGVHIGRVLAVSENKQTVLERLIDIPPAQRESVESTAETIASESSLTRTTVRRYLYELADENVLARKRATESSDREGTGSTRLEPWFPATVFKQLRERHQ